MTNRPTPHLPPGSVCILGSRRMSSERDVCRRRADDAKQRAAQASESFFKSAYEKVAEHWMVPAQLDSLLSLLRDEKPKQFRFTAYWSYINSGNAGHLQPH